MAVAIQDGVRFNLFFPLKGRAMICLFVNLSDQEFSGEMNSLVEAYRVAGAFHPDISLAIADYYEKSGEKEKRNVFIRQSADCIG